MKKSVIRILEVNKAYYPHIGGIESLVKQYAENFSNKAEVKVLVCREDRGRTFHETINGISVTRAGSMGTYFSCPLSFSFIRLFKKMAKEADIIHINVPFPIGDLACLLSGYKGKVVIGWHSDVVKQKKLLFFYKPIMMRFLKRSDAILVATKGHIDGSPYISKFRDKCHVIPYGLDVDEYLKAERIPVLSNKLNDKSKLKVFFTGRLVYYKGIDVLLKAFKQIESCELFIAGTGALDDELKAFVKDNDMEDKVHFMGFLPDDTLKSAFADCDIFVLPSVANSEAFGIVQLEAMIYSKPVINTSLPTGVPYVSLDGISGITVEPNNVSALADALNKLAENSELRLKFGQNAYNRVINDFNNSTVLDKIFTLFKQL